MFLFLLFVMKLYSDSFLLPFSGKKQRSFMKERFVCKDQELSNSEEISPTKPVPLNPQSYLEWEAGLRDVLMRKNKKEALDYCTKMLTVDPYNPYVWQLRSHYRGSFRGQIEDLSQAIRWDRTNGSIYWERAKVYYQKGDIDSCLKDLETIRQMNAYVELGFLLKGHCFFSLKKYRQAQEMYREQCLTGIGEYESLFFLGLTHIILREWAQGETVYIRLCQKRQNDWQSLYNYAYCLLKLGRYRQSRELLEQVVDLNPSFFYAWYHLAVIEVIMGLLDVSMKKIEWLETQLQDDELLGQVTLLKAQIFIMKGSFSKGLSLFLQLDGTDWLVSFHRMLGLWMSGQWEKVYFLLKEDIYPVFLKEIYFFRAVACEKLSYLEEAKQNYVQFFQLMESDVEAFCFQRMNLCQLSRDAQQDLRRQSVKRYCDILWTQGHYDLYLESESFWERLGVSNNDGCDLFRRAYSLSQSEKIECQLQAQSLFEQCIQVNYQVPICYYNMGNVSFRLGHYQEALVDYTKAIQSDSSLSEAYFNRSQIYRILNQNRKAQADMAFYKKKTSSKPIVRLLHNLS